jgi:hypothetical protein
MGGLTGPTLSVIHEKYLVMNLQISGETSENRVIPRNFKVVLYYRGNTRGMEVWSFCTDFCTTQYIKDLTSLGTPHHTTHHTTPDLTRDTITQNTHSLDWSSYQTKTHHVVPDPVITLHRTPYHSPIAPHTLPFCTTTTSTYQHLKPKQARESTNLVGTHKFEQMPLIYYTHTHIHPPEREKDENPFTETIPVHISPCFVGTTETYELPLTRMRKCGTECVGVVMGCTCGVVNAHQHIDTCGGNYRHRSTCCRHYRRCYHFLLPLLVYLSSALLVLWFCALYFSVLSVRSVEDYHYDAANLIYENNYGIVEIVQDDAKTVTSCQTFALSKKGDAIEAHPKILTSDYTHSKYDLRCSCVVLWVLIYFFK